MGIKVDIKRKLGEFSLDIHFQTESKRIGILGASGCGKSMTLKSIAGIETPDFGMIQIDDKVLFDSANKVDLKPQKKCRIPLSELCVVSNYDSCKKYCGRSER